MNDINAELKELYSQKWNRISEFLNEINANEGSVPVSNPLLI